MKRGYPPIWLGLLILLLALCWKMLDAPVTAKQFQALETPFWQARVLAPTRIRRILTLWMPVQRPGTSDDLLVEDGMDEDAKELVRRQSPQQKEIKVWLEEAKTTVSMPLESYVCGVVAAEMPAAYHEQALAAQAVAARTRALAQMEKGGCPSHPEADVCGDSGCCQGYAGCAECKKKWGEEYSVYRQRIVSAVKLTGDELLTYEGKPITVLYHAMSGGVTESAQAVFAQDLPYLVSVESQGEENARGFLTETHFLFAEAAEKLNLQFPTLHTTGDELRRTLIIGSYTPAGRVATLLVGKRELDAQQVRKALDLRSTWFSITTDETGVTFHQRGYGHGVGMSQVGANSMAANGADYRAILAHYYPGATLEKQ